MTVTHVLSYGMTPDSLTPLRSISRQRVPPRNSPLFAIGPLGGYAVAFVFWICVLHFVVLVLFQPKLWSWRDGLMWALSSGLTLFPCKGAPDSQRKDYSSFCVD